MKEVHISLLVIPTNEKEKFMKEVHIRLRGDLYSQNTHCATLKDAMKKYRLKRHWIADWWKEESK